MSSSPDRKNAHDYRAPPRLGTETWAMVQRPTLATAGSTESRSMAKPDLTGSADPIFRGDAGVHNPEDLFIAALSSCHLLSYLALCARSKINVVAYEDNAIGTMVLRPDGGGKFESVTLRPKVTIARGQRREARAGSCTKPRTTSVSLPRR